MYGNPAINVALTFMEVFPIGLAVTLLSAGILRKQAGKCPPDDRPVFLGRLRDTFARLTTLHHRMLVLEMSTLLELRCFSIALTSL